ncbi:hypothetical protein ACS0TY_032952 [Phlomoides rotata]
MWSESLLRRFGQILVFRVCARTGSVSIQTDRIPTSTHLRRGLYFEEQGKVRKVDVKNLGVIERKDLMERLVKIAKEDNGKFLLKIKKRIDRVGIDLPTVEVRFEQL